MNIHSFGDLPQNKNNNQEGGQYRATNSSNEVNNESDPNSSKPFFNPDVFQFKTFSFVIIVINILIAITEVAYAYFAKKNTTCTLYLLGGKFTPAIVHNYHIWRLITPVILHASFVHLSMNTMSIGCLSFYVENYIGTKLFIILYLVSGVYGNLFSAVMITDSVGVGASGAIMGLSGFLLFYFMLNYYKISAGEKRFFIYFLVITLINLFTGGIAKDGNIVDNYAHFGGFVTGAFLSVYLVGNKLDYRFFTVKHIQIIKIVFGILLGIIPLGCFGYMFTAKIPQNSFGNHCQLDS